MMEKGKRVLVTGAGGFTGKYVTKALQVAGWEVFGVSRCPSSGSGSLSLGEFTDIHRMSLLLSDINPHAVVHLAGISFVDHYDQLEMYKFNTFGTLNLMRAIKEAGVCPRVLIASSANVYGTPTCDLISEVVCPAPVNHYAMSKLSMEYLVKSDFQDLKKLIVRPFNYTGRGQSKNFLIPKIVDHFRKRCDFIELGNLDVARDFLDVRDVADAYVRLLESDQNFDTVNICSGEMVSLQEVLVFLAEFTGHRLDVRINSSLVRFSEIRRLIGDNSRLKQAGWTRTYSFHETLNWMLTEV